MGKFDLEEILKNNFSLLERDESSSLKRIRLWIFHRWYLKGSKGCWMFFSFLVFIDDLSFQRLFFFFLHIRKESKESESVHEQRFELLIVQQRSQGKASVLDRQRVKVLRAFHAGKKGLNGQLPLSRLRHSFTEVEMCRNIHIFILCFYIHIFYNSFLRF